MTAVPGEKKILDLLRRSLRGKVVGAKDDSYGRARRVWNGAIDRFPLAIASCVDAPDVGAALAIAREHGIAVTVRGGGHNVAGLAVRDAAIQLDLSAMRGVAVDVPRSIATVQGGALWSDVDNATAAHGLATTGGMVSTTGVGGLTLGGGAGWLMRRYGLACDNLIGAQVVLADGRQVRTAADEHSDLLWLLRGGGGQIGVVTEFQFRLHPLQNVLAGLVIHPGDATAGVLRTLCEYAATAPDEFCGLAVIAHAPPLPFIPAEWHGRPVIILAMCWCGEVAQGERALAPLRRFGKPIADVVQPFPYAAWQQMQDPGAPPGRFQYWKTATFNTLPDNTINILAEAAQRLPGGFTELHVQHFGGAVARVPDVDTAFAHRGVGFFVNLIGATADQAAFEPTRTWVRKMHAKVAREALPGMLVNFSDADETSADARFGQGNLQMILETRRAYDPAGAFSH